MKRRKSDGQAGKTGSDHVDGRMIRAGAGCFREKGSTEKWRALNHTAMLSPLHSYVWSALHDASIPQCGGK